MPQHATIPIVDIGIPTGKNQQPEFWRSLMGLQWGGGAFMASGGALTDINRNNIAHWFYEERKNDSEWLFFVDDDVELPDDTLTRLLSYDKPFVTGIYYRRSPPCEPLIYKREEESGWYVPLLPETDYRTGELIEVDGCGLGCALIHRSVFSAILENHFLYRRHNRSFGFMHYSAVEKTELELEPGVFVHDDGSAYHVQRIQRMLPDALSPRERLPFFAFEYGRTEDFHFCELVKDSGVEIWADTGLELKHWGSTPITRIQHDQIQKWMQEQNVENVDGLAIQEIDS